MPNTLFLYLQGPLQSWGERAQWSVRDTRSEPTKSGIVGLLGCALGWNTDSQLSTLSHQIRMGVRCDLTGTLLVDYHTVGGGYGYPTLLTAEGKRKISSGRAHTEQTWRSYLADAAFLAAVQAEEALIAELVSAVQDPIWPYFLGRKSCPPTRPIFDGTGDYSSLREALQAHPISAEILKSSHDSSADQRDHIQRRVIIECSSSTENSTRRNDELKSRSRRIFVSRYVEEGSVEAPLPKEVT